MNNKTGSMRPKNANAIIAKNTTAVMTMSPRIIPFLNYFTRGSANVSTPAPTGSWLTRK